MSATKPWKTHFELDPRDIELIEVSLRERLTEIALSPNAEDKMRMREIRDLIGKLHNQKIYYDPNRSSDTFVPLG